ncbi:Stk1 family PASTA domain-containing Ser/Thr kinase [Psychromicrobium lacuslunae]|uniref:non-specific serine/threonine protein kinase n=1 Tax=Psychromicrobium lacuslunae TaxID=1618207 RepID=A0A0D4BW71_9MICC|nr:Stk1 family PASTA domain-containing Ser/Thr kinase [Psychromicrobium lacuslunae]AJT40707.1 protein kinase [Psychromicrobium lacuslunae]
MQDIGPEPLLGRLVDQRYKVLSRVARGGMATVYLATDLRLDRPVALKVLHPHLSMDDSFLDRLGSEAKAAAKLSHPHVVGVLDQGEELIDGNRLAYLVMEYLPGHTLRDVLLAQGSLTPRLALAYLDAVVEGLAAAHRAGLVHRDVKPENVLIADDGRIKIGDFGLARAVTTSTNTGTLIGTVAYLSPELVMGRTADARSDIYAIGIMLYELLTGEQPFRGEVPIQVAYQHVNSSVPAPSAELPGLAADLDELVRWCTEADPEDRPHDADALLGELRHIRTTLSDEQLDYSNSAVVKPTPPNYPPTAAISSAPGATEALPRATETEAISRPTEFLDRSVHPTTVLDRGAAAATAQGSFDSPAAAQLSPRAARVAEKKAQKQAAREAARNAARPVTTLRHGNTRRRGLIWLILIVILALLGGTAGWFFGLGPGALATVPDLKNKTVSEAQAALQTLGFSTTLQKLNDENIATDRVIATEPAAFVEQRKFQPVVLKVSLGPTLYTVPNLVAANLDAAKSQLNQNHLALGKVSQQFDEKVPAGQVISQNPAAGTQKRGATPIDLLLSQGPKPIPVPSVVGQTQQKANETLGGLGLKVVVAANQVFDSDIPAGSVVSQEPSSGTLPKGGTVNLVISKGPKMVLVPSFVGQQIDDVIAQLKNLKLKYNVTEILGGFFGTVRAQDPMKTSVPEGTVIELTVV